MPANFYKKSIVIFFSLKLVLFFGDFFWDRTERVFGYVHDSTERRGELFLFWSITDRPCLIALVAGKAAIALETEVATIITQRDEDDMTAYLKLPIVSRAMTILRKIFGRQQINTVPDVCSILLNVSTTLSRF